MPRYGAHLASAVAVLLLAGVVVAQDVAQDVTEESAETTTELPPQDAATGDYYPISWTKINYKPLMDNERLFRKYKQCVLAVKPTGCPRDILELKSVIPEVLESMCAKCLPVHIETFKGAAEYLCKTRRSVYDEVRKARDPDGSLQKKFEDKFGKVNC